MIGNRSSQKKILSVWTRFQGHITPIVWPASRRWSWFETCNSRRNKPRVHAGVWGGCAIAPGLFSMRHGSRNRRDRDLYGLCEWQGCKPRLIIERRDPSRTRNICSSPWNTLCDLHFDMHVATPAQTRPLQNVPCMHDVGPVSHPRHTRRLRHTYNDALDPETHPRLRSVQPKLLVLY